jgi:hypothetical protein
MSEKETPFDFFPNSDASIKRTVQDALFGYVKDLRTNGGGLVDKLCLVIATEEPRTRIYTQLTEDFRKKSEGDPRYVALSQAEADLTLTFANVADFPLSVRGLNPRGAERLKRRAQKEGWFYAEVEIVPPSQETSK